ESKMMKTLFTILFFLIGLFVFGQSSSLKEAFTKLDKALVEKDTVALKELLHNNVTFGHSNGWVESKDDVVRDVKSGKLAYQTIKSDSITWKVETTWASVRSITKVEVAVDGNKTELKLHILEVWLRTEKGWQLIARQSTKL